jgi:hypothetical protein
MIFSIIAFVVFMSVFLTVNAVSQTAQDLALAITLHADAEAGIPEVDRNGNKWSWEQLRVLRAFAKALYEYARYGKPISIAVSAVAGSGKTSLLQGMTHIVAKLCPELLTSMTAFNRHIADSSKDILIQFQSSDGLNIKIFGNSNTVNAGGKSLLDTKAKSCGFTRVDFPSASSDRYVRLARLTLSGWLAREDRMPLLQSAKEQMQVYTTSHAFNEIVGDLVKVCNMLMDEGYVPRKTVRKDVDSKDYQPPKLSATDIEKAKKLVQRIGVNQGWAENNARCLGDGSVFELVVEILSVAVETAFLKVDLKPFCDGKSIMDAIVPQKDYRDKYWVDAGPVRSFINTTDPKHLEWLPAKILENGGCAFPPKIESKKGSSGGGVSIATKKKCVLLENEKGEVIMSFENGGHAQRLGKKAIGTQFGNKGDYSVDGERISSWRTFDRQRELTIIHPQHLSKVVALLKEQFGDELDNRLDHDDVEVEYVENHGVLYLSMADQIYLPHALDLQCPEHEKADVMMIDEVQDLSILKANLVWRLAKDNAHKIIVGDLRQAIYLFAGASSSAFQENAEKIGAEFYPQTICWRGTEMVAASSRVACEGFANQVLSRYPNADLPDYQSHRSPLEAGYDFWEMGAYPTQIEIDEVVEAYQKSRELHGEDTSFGLICRLKKPLSLFIMRLLKGGIPISTPKDKNGDGIVKEAFSIANRHRTDTSKKITGKTIIGLGWNKMKGDVCKNPSILMRDLHNIRDAIFSKFSDLYKGDTKSMANDNSYLDNMGNVELLEAFLSLFIERYNNTVEIKNDVSSTLSSWVESELFSERGGSAVHLATLHKYKGDEADIMFVVESYKDRELITENNPNGLVECFMNERSMEASVESAINEANMGYVAYTRAKKQNIIIRGDCIGQYNPHVSQRLEGAFNHDTDLMFGITTKPVEEVEENPVEEPDNDFDKCVECNTIIAEGEEHGVCCACGGHLCRVRTPTHSKSGKFERHNGGQICNTSCGTYLNHISLDELFDRDFDKESRRHCSTCHEESKKV